MRPMTSYKQGDVVLVPFPFTDLSTHKQRPAVVLSSRSHSSTHPDVILAPVTSRAAHALDEVSLADWANAGLLKPSVVKPILASCEMRLIIRKLGSLSAPDLAQVRALFARILELT